MPDAEEEQSSTARPFWSGTITFGLVTIPVSLFPANRGSRVALHMYSPTGVRLRRRYYSPETGKDLENEDIVRGYEIEKGKFVVVTDQELERLAPESSRDIDLRRFVPYEHIPKLYFNRGYFLTPASGSAKAYRLLAQAMEARGRAGIATFVMRGKEYLVAIIAESGLLRAETLRFVDEIRSAPEVGLPEPPRISAASVRKFEHLVKDLSCDTLPKHELKDAESERLLRLIHRKEQEEDDTAVAPKRRHAPKPVDLLQVLQQALAKQAERDPENRTRSTDNSGDDLRSLSRSALYRRAKELAIRGRSSMDKHQLIQAIRGQAA